MIIIILENFHLLQLITFLTVMTQPTSGSGTTPVPPNFSLAKPNCIDRCGNVSIPYPFGTTPDCYESSSFWVTCNKSSSMQSKLFIDDSSIEIIDISLDGQLRVMQYIARSCYDQNGSWVSEDSNRAFIRLVYPYTINNTANKFTVIGCDNFGNISGWRQDDRYYSTGCIATCREMGDLQEGSCEGLGCCQITSIPKNVRTVNLGIGSLNNRRQVVGFNNCSYGFFAEESAFRFSPQNLTNLRDVKELPMIVDWTVGWNETCESAKANRSSYACVSSNSECHMPVNGTAGYRCKCMEGYRGNPYLNDSCKDIDECNEKIANCVFKCDNSPGNYSCYCPKGYIGNGIGERGCLCPKGSDDSGNLRDRGCIRAESHIYKPVAGTALGIILVMLVVSLLYLVLQRRRLEKMKLMFFLRNGGMLLQEKLITAGNIRSINTERERSSSKDIAKFFSSTELHHATNNFHNNMIIGQGGFGTVYKGFLKDNRIVAVKKAKDVDPTQIDQFINEVVVLSQVSHRNIVKLLGCCLETPAPLLVYEFIDNGTLYDHIHNQDRRRFLGWNMRLKIASEAADVLSYLHSAASTPIIHRDVKSANILLDHNFEAKVSDFGASRLVPLDQTQISTMVQGTFGYLDPEYMQTNQLTEKSDVYSFGVVLVELLTGLKPLGYDRPEEERNLSNFFLRKLQQGCLLEVLDETIPRDRGYLEQQTEVAKLARVCLNVKGQDRPSMKEVAMELEGLKFGGKHSWVKFEQKVEEMEPFCGDVLDTFVNDNSCSTSIGYISFRDQAKLHGGR